MRIISIRVLKEFWKLHSDVEEPLKAWYELVKNANWEKPNDIKEAFRSADIIQNDRVVFNIKGNKYRLIVKMHYRYKIVYIRFIGTHKNYDKIDATSV